MDGSEDLQKNEETMIDEAIQGDVKNSAASEPCTEAAEPASA